MKSVFVFKTSVATGAEVIKLKPMLDNLIRQGERWNFDLEDCDNILRVESVVCNAGQVITLLKVAGYDCEELQ
jgi:hypothetical protein